MTIAPTSPRPHAARSGFTLVELSIVLAIIGILTGAVIAGQHIMHTLRLKRVGEDYQKYTAAVQQFSDRYKALPGDMPNATSYWGVVTGGGAACTAPTSAAGGNAVGSGSGTQTCNGNGDYMISNYLLSNLYHEAFRAWQHLSRAELISGTYTGTRALSTDNLSHLCPGNCPVGPLKGTGWKFAHVSDLSASVATNNPYFNKSYCNMLEFGLISGRSTNLGGLTPQEAWDLDKKYDDGLPAQGNITVSLSGGATVADCTTANNDSSQLTATYSTTTDTNICGLIFLLPDDVRGPQ